MIIEERLLHLLKAYLPIDMRFEVMFTVSKLMQLSNADSLIDVTAGGIVMDVNDLHPANARLSMDVTDDGIVIDARFLQYSKALNSIDVIFD